MRPRKVARESTKQENLALFYNPVFYILFSDEANRKEFFYNVILLGTPEDSRREYSIWKMKFKLLILGLMVASAVGSAPNEKNGKFFAAVSSKFTQSVITTLTTSMVTTCLSVIDTPTCTGRRRRAAFADIENLEKAWETGVDDLDASQDKGNLSAVEEEETKDDAGKIFTINSTIYSTLTVYTTSFYAGTAVTVSALCTLAALTAACTG
ncbi:uncharacterized protein LOC143035562 [Oratosquilla oratoria]|uniref:uncharacterized protein LOC143035562 n=1 Tax=Oratosquilla oratoria TaxID=337810 RepID=UPI003F765E49